MKAPDDRRGPKLADVGDIVCCLAFAITSVIAALAFADIASFAWRYLGVLLSPLMG